MPFISNGIYIQGDTSTAIMSSDADAGTTTRILSISDELASDVLSSYTSNMYLATFYKLGYYDDDHLFVITTTSGSTIEWVDYSFSSKTMTKKSCAVSVSGDYSYNKKHVHCIIPNTYDIILFGYKNIYKINLSTATATLLQSSISMSQYFDCTMSSDADMYVISDVYTSSDYGVPLYKYDYNSNTLTKIMSSTRILIDVIDRTYYIFMNFTSSGAAVVVRDSNNSSIDISCSYKFDQQCKRAFLCKRGIVEVPGSSVYSESPFTIDTYRIVDKKLKFGSLGYFRYTASTWNEAYTTSLPATSSNTHPDYTTVSPQYFHIDGSRCMCSLYTNSTRLPSNYMIEHTYKEKNDD